MNATDPLHGAAAVPLTRSRLGRGATAAAALLVSALVSLGCSSSRGAGAASSDAGSDTGSAGADAGSGTGSGSREAGSGTGAASPDAGGGQTDAASPGEAGAPACVPDDGADCAGKCGQVKGRCGTTVSCPGCPSGETCGGGGTPNVCGEGSCAPDCSGKACGASDGCGGICQAGACGAGQRCAAGSCVCDATSCGSGCCGDACCAATRATAIGAGYEHTCAVTTAGGVLCWGDNTYGELGDGTTTNRDTPVPVTGLASGVRAVALGETFTCALTTAGAVLCWGEDAYGELGNGATTSSPTPTAVSGLTSGVTAIAAGATHSCAVTGSGVVCWGFNGSGQLGDGTKTNSDVPVQVSGLPSGTVAVAAGTAHTCALGSGGVACWGDDAEGDLGDGTATQTPSLVPVTVDPAYLGTNVSAIGACGNYSCVIAGQGGVACWGLGDGANVAWDTPQGLDGVGPGVTQLGMGASHSCYLVAGAASCRGTNQEGELGNGSTTTSVEAPVPVSGLGSGVAAVATGTFHSCALTTGGSVQCWGRNLEGELGNGSTAGSLVPVTVSGF